MVQDANKAPDQAQLTMNEIDKLTTLDQMIEHATNLRKQKKPEKKLKPEPVKPGQFAEQKLFIRKMPDAEIPSYDEDQVSEDKDEFRAKLKILFQHLFDN